MSVSTFAPASAGLQPYEKTFYESEVWTVPSGVKTVEVIAVGGGGGTSSIGGYSYNGFAGSGGVANKIVDVSTSSTVNITVGAGSQTTEGTMSSFGNLVMAAGGGPAIVPNIADYYQFGSMNGALTNMPGDDYCIPQYPVGTGTFTENYGLLYPTAIAGDYAFVNFMTSNWQFTSISTPSARGVTPSLVYAPDKYGYRVSFDSGYYYFQSRVGSSTSANLNQRIPAPATPAAMATATATGFATAYNYYFLAAFNKLYMPVFTGGTGVSTSSNQGSTWTNVAATITGATTVFESGSNVIEPFFDGNVMIFASPGYIYTSTDGVNFKSYSHTAYNTSTSGFINKIENNKYIIVGKTGSGVTWQYFTLSSPYTTLTLTANATVSYSPYADPGTNYYMPGKTPNGWVAYYPLGASAWLCYGGDESLSGKPMSNVYDTGQQSGLISTYSFMGKTSYDYATNTFVGIYDYGQVSGGYMFKSYKTIGKVNPSAFSYSGSGNGGVGAGGKGAISKWVNTYERTIQSPGPGLLGYGNGAGNGVTPGSGKGSGSAAQNGIVVVRWWA